MTATIADLMPERALQQAVEGIARTYGWKCYHTHDSRRSQPGFPDIVLVKDGRLIFAELKSAKGRLSQPQKDWIGALERTAAEVFVWRPADLVDGSVLAALKAGGY